MLLFHDILVPELFQGMARDRPINRIMAGLRRSFPSEAHAAHEEEEA